MKRRRSTSNSPVAPRKRLRCDHRHGPVGVAGSATKPNGQPSPLLQLPLEIRLKILEYVVGGKTVHIEQLSRFTQSVLERRDIHTATGLYNELCNADETEEAAYQQFMSDEQSVDVSAKTRTPFYNAVTGADLGHGYHVSAWTTRHKNCAREPNPRRIRFELEAWLHRPKLSLDALRICKQIHAEARLLPYSKNVFAFGSAATFQAFALSRRRDQLRALSQLNLLVCVGMAPFSDARARDWVQALAWRDIAGGIAPLRKLNVSVECYNITAPEMAVFEKPRFEHFFSEVEGPGRRWTSWMEELGVLCGNGCTLTVTLADDPLSPWGPIGKTLYCSDTMIKEEEWLRKRNKTCLTVTQKREYATRITDQLRKHPQEWRATFDDISAKVRPVTSEALMVP